MKYLIGAFLLVFAMAMTGCKATKALDSTIQMNGKMDKMIKQMGNMDQKMKQMSQMNSKMTGMGQGMTNMEALMKELGLELAVALAYKETIQTTYSTPVDAMPGALKLVEKATTEEILKITYVTMKKISGIPSGLIDGQKQLTMEEKISYSFGLNAIGYMLKPHNLKEIVEDHILGRTDYEHVGKALLAYRAQILYMVAMGKNKAIKAGEKDPKKPTNVKLLSEMTKEVVAFFEIADLPFADEIEHKLLPQNNFFDFKTFQPKNMADFIKNGIELGLDCKNVKTSKDQDEVNKIILAVTDWLTQYGVEPPKNKCQ